MREREPSLEEARASFRHELNTPLTAVNSYYQLLREPDNGLSAEETTSAEAALHEAVGKTIKSLADLFSSF